MKSRFLTILLISAFFACASSQFIGFNWNLKKPNDTSAIPSRMITKGWSEGDDYYLCGLRVTNFTMVLLKGNYTFTINQVPNINGLTNCIKTGLWKVTPFYGNYTSPVFVTDFDYSPEYCGGPDRRTFGCQRYFDLYNDYQLKKSGGCVHAPNVFFFEKVGSYETSPDGFPVLPPDTIPPSSGASAKSNVVSEIFDYLRRILGK